MSEYEHCYITVNRDAAEDAIFRLGKVGWELAAALSESHEVRLFFRRRL
jgi:hypothetical protein